MAQTKLEAAQAAYIEAQAAYIAALEGKATSGLRVSEPIAEVEERPLYVSKAPKCTTRGCYKQGHRFYGKNGARNYAQHCVLAGHAR